MKHIVCFSGGHSSAIVAIEVARKYGKENVILLNHECILEDKDVERFENEIANYLGLSITYANFENSDVKDQFDVVIDKGSFVSPQNRQALCTHVMKTQPFEKYMRLNFLPKNTLFESKKECIVYYGFDKNEPTRMQRRTGILAAQGYRTDYPLALWKERTIHSTTEIGIKAPNLYSKFKHANCIGCLKAGWQHWYIVYCEYPKIFEKAKETEHKIGYSINKSAFLYEKEIEFAKMVKMGIEPSEHTPHQTFWANVRKKTKCFEDEETAEIKKPCECIF